MDEIKVWYEIWKSRTDLQVVFPHQREDYLTGNFRDWINTYGRGEYKDIEIKACESYTSDREQYEAFTQIHKKPLVVPIWDNASEITPKVSFIVISHNRPAYLNEALQSLLSQTNSNWEAVVLETSLDTEPLNVLRSYREDKRIRVFALRCDSIAMLWNIGIDLARGKYISFFDDDNRKKSDFVETMAGYLDTHEDDSVVCSFVGINERGKVCSSPWPLPEKITLQDELKHNKVDSGALVFRKEVVDKIGWIDERLSTTEDWDFAIRILSHGMTIGIVREALSEYRHHSENRMHYSERLGGRADEKFIMSKEHKKRLRLLALTPIHQSLTLSQKVAIEGITDGLSTIEWISADVITDISSQEGIDNYDYVLIIFPLCIPKNVIQSCVQRGLKVVTIHIEEPQSLLTNIDKFSGVHVAIVNDSSVVPTYEKIIGKGHVYVWNNLCINDVKLKMDSNPNYEKRDIDVLFIGHPFQSRVDFVRDLSEQVCRRGWKMACIGDGWKSIVPREVECYPTLDDEKTLEILRRAWIIVVKDRAQSDLGGSVIQSLNVHRGYFESVSGAVVCVYNAEGKMHYFDENVFIYKTMDELLKKIDTLIGHREECMRLGTNSFYRAMEKYTYRYRLRKILLALKSMRYGYVGE